MLGVESSKEISSIANKSEIPTINTFFNLKTANELDRSFDVINASGVFFHLEELHSACEGIKSILKKKGVFVVQFLYMKSIVKNCAFDQIYHEHLLYYTIKTINFLLEIHDLKMFDAYFSPIHGGSIIGYISHPGVYRKTKQLEKLEHHEKVSKCNVLSAYHAFAKKIIVMKKKNRHFLLSNKKKGKTIYGFGAPVKGNTLLNYFGINKEIIDCLVEKNPLRRGLFSPGMHIPRLLEDEIKQLQDIYNVLAWKIKNKMLDYIQKLLEHRVKFIFQLILNNYHENIHNRRFWILRKSFY